MYAAMKSFPEIRGNTKQKLRKRNADPVRRNKATWRSISCQLINEVKYSGRTDDAVQTTLPAYDENWFVWEQIEKRQKITRYHEIFYAKFRWPSWVMR